MYAVQGKHLVSGGGYIYLWDWRSGHLITKFQATSSGSTVSSVGFSSDAKFIVTAGKKHLKFWTLESSRKTQQNGGMRRTARSASLAIHEKLANLSIEKDCSFTSIASSVWTNSSDDNRKQAGGLFPIYALTDSGILYLIHSGLSVKKSVILKVQRAFALSTSEKLIACACNNGTVLLYTPVSLEYVGSILYSKAKKFYEENNTVYHAVFPEQNSQQLPALPDAVACQFLAFEKLVVIYSDHSLYIWDIHDVNQATKCFVLVSHSSCIWDIKNLCCENMHDPSLACTAKGCSGGISFATCSADGTIRLWDISLQSDLSKDAKELKNELLGSSCLVSAGTFERDAVKVDLNSQEFRSLAVSSDGKHLAAGDCNGNLHIYNLQTSDYTCLQGAHDAEILTLSFTLSTQDIYGEIAKGSYFLASGGRDCMIHLYDAERNFDLIGSVGNHSAAVTSIKISSDSCKILSCSADSFLVVHDVVIADNGYKIFMQHRQRASQCGTVYDMAVDQTCETVVTVGQDKKIKAFDMETRRLIRSYNHDNSFGEPIKVIMDPSCTYVVCSFSNKSICIYDFMTGEMVAKATGHAEIVTGVIFLPDCKHLVSVDGDGCVFVWKLPTPLSSKILEKIMEKSNPLPSRIPDQPPACSHLSSCKKECQHCKINHEDVCSFRKEKQSRNGVLNSKSSHRETPSFKYSISRLPRWAQAKVTDYNNVCKNVSDTSLEAYSALSPEIQIPSDHASLSPETVSTQCSSRPRGTFNNTDLDNHWRSVYTVCMDALSSPEMQNILETRFRKTSSSLRWLIPGQDRAMNSENQISFKHSSLNEEMGVVLDQRIGKKNDSFGYSEEVSDRKAEQSHLEESGSMSKTTLDDNLDSLRCEEESGIFKRHFGSLSNTHKMESRNSSVRRFSARYTVQWDYAGDYKKLFSSPVRNMPDSKRSKEEAATDIIPESRSSQFMEIEEVGNSCEQDPAKEGSTVDRLGLDRDQKEGGREGSELQETIAACKKAFGSLDAAAESAVQLFSKLESYGEEVSSDGVQFLKDAAELLPLIVEKVNTVARLVQCRKNNKSGSGLGVPEAS
ncbi:WD repeat-containing protein 62 isoform X3 [Medicago truncatula]|uniref:WD repeat-containing protein 62 isoform X3 n=1 Tax=Medicago truncatula TaxID=3880 RepID=UPI000D2F2BF5|nr:WD repeat-containing protein 62 isoform X3 [Medicago truncatula]